MSHEIPEYVTAKNIDNMHRCPKCGSWSTRNGSTFWEDGNGIYNHSRCYECGAHWENHYAYTHTDFYIEED